MSKTDEVILFDSDVEITETLRKEFKAYNKWFNKMERKGFNMDDRAMNARDSIFNFAQRYNDLRVERDEISHFDNTILNEMKSRSFEGGTSKQLTAYYETIKGGMEDLKKTNPELYEQLNAKYHFEELGEQDLGDLERHGAHLMNKNRRDTNLENAGLLDALYLELSSPENGIKMIFNSPEA